MNVSRWMTRTLITCRPEHSLARAAQLCWEHDVGAVPVTDADGKLVGMITDRDLCMAAFTRGASLAEHTVASAMATKLFTLAPKDSLKKAQELLRVHQLRRLPVVDAKGVLVGLITLQDLATKTFGELPRAKRKQAAVAIAETLARIATPRPAAKPAPAEAQTTATSPAASAPSTAAKAVLSPAKSSKKSAPRQPAPRASKPAARRRASARRAVAKAR
ncbi:MAG: CBS domain-containing protein [Planctomycetes bacterium]|nr:CBS domain-containing protein [Planctomycetota bacterium]